MEFVPGNEKEGTKDKIVATFYVNIDGKEGNFPEIVHNLDGIYGIRQTH